MMSSALEITILVFLGPYQALNQNQYQMTGGPTKIPFSGNCHLILTVCCGKFVAFVVMSQLCCNQLLNHTTHCLAHQH